MTHSPSQSSKSSLSNQLNVKWYFEYHCSLCDDVIHNHFDCPNCKTKNAGTSLHSEIEEGLYFNCEKCGATFELLNLIYDDDTDDDNDSLTINDRAVIRYVI